MHEKLNDTPTSWVDPDDAPELTDEFFAKGRWFTNGNEVSRAAGEIAMRAETKRGRPKSSRTKQALTVRYDAEVIAAFKATGAGWQTRMNDALKDWLITHQLAASSE